MEAVKTSAAIRWGALVIAPVVDWAGEVPNAGALLPDTERADWERHRALLTSVGAWDPDTDRRAFSVHSWVLRVDGFTVLVDTGAGNGKDLPGLPLFSGLSTSYLDELARAGVRPQDVDFVINTHLHADHVGWNTRRVADEWVPTFPNARYLLPAAEVEFWNPANGHTARTAEANRNAFADSVRPVLEAGQADIWSGTRRISPGLTLFSAPGHTPGSSVLAADCGGGSSALFVGDLFHTPLQVVEPQRSSCHDEDPRLARESRRRILAQAADDDALVLAAHLPGARALRVGRGQAGFTVEHWHTAERVSW